MSEWISVRDRLPEESGDYLVFTEYGKVRILPYSKKYKAFNAFDDLKERWNEKRKISVTHWRPLPEPPEAAIE